MALINIRDRIVELRRCKPGELADHPHQWKVHPPHQREALEGVLREIGMAGALLVWPCERLGGQLTTWDGHMRKSLDPDIPWPTLVTDLTDAEADTMLAVYDPIAALAQSNQEKLDGLFREIKTGEAAVQQVLSDLAKKEGLYQDLPRSLDELGDEHGEPDASAMWPVFRLKVPPDLYTRLQGLLAQAAGATDAERLDALLNAVDEEALASGATA